MPGQANRRHRTTGEVERSSIWRVSTCSACQSRADSEWGLLCGEEVRTLGEARIAKTYRPGQIIFYAATACMGLHCVERGAVAIRKTDPNGNTLMLRLATRGDTLGYRTFFSGRPYSADGVALTECTVCFIPRRAVMGLLESNPSLGLKFMERLARDLREAEEAKLRAVSMPLRAQLAHLLLQLKDDFGEASEDGSLVLSLPMSRRDMASMLGTRPETVTRLVKALEADGVATFERRRVTIPDLDLIYDELEEYGEY